MIAINIMLMVWWIIATAQNSNWTFLTLGTISFALVLIGLSYYLFWTLKERQFYRRQMNFVDSVTHELKSPIASLRLYLETLQLRELEPDKRREFYVTMDSELKRLDEMISSLLRVARLDAIGQELPVSDYDIAPVLRRLAETACHVHNYNLDEVFEFETQPLFVRCPQIMTEMIFNNLFDNAIKYGGQPPKVTVRALPRDRSRIEISTIDNGPGISPELKRNMFQLFFRGGNELERTQKGTGIGLYVAQTLIRKIGGKLKVQNCDDQPGSCFTVELPGKSEVPESLLADAQEIATP